MSPSRRQAIIWTNTGISSIGPLGTQFSEILIEIHTFSFTKMQLKMSGKWRPFCLGLNVLTRRHIGIVDCQLLDVGVSCLCAIIVCLILLYHGIFVRPFSCYSHNKSNPFLIYLTPSGYSAVAINGNKYLLIKHLCMWMKYQELAFMIDLNFWKQNKKPISENLHSWFVMSLSLGMGANIFIL